jgi:hypothetical protein
LFAGRGQGGGGRVSGSAARGSQLRLNYVILLLEFGDYPFLYRRKVLMLQSRQLYQLWRPHRLYVAMLPRRRNDRTRNQILVGINNFVILQREQREEVNILFHEGDRLLVRLNRMRLIILLAEHLIIGKHDTLRHEYLDDVVKEWVRVKFEYHQV